MKIVFKCFLLMFAFQVSHSETRFSHSEISQVRQQSRSISDTAARCLETKYNEHIAFYSQWGFSKFYGNQIPEHESQSYRLNVIKNLPKVRRLSLDEKKALVESMEPTACIKLTIQCLGKGFRMAGLNSTWNKIYSQLAVKNNFYGTDLIKSLSQLGWRVLYWNPDPSSNNAWDQEDKRLVPLKAGETLMPSWGDHWRFYESVRRNGYYGSVKVYDPKTLVGFEDQAPPLLARTPFFVGIAHAGYHVFAGSRGVLVEAYGARQITDKGNLQRSPFNPLAPNGGPRWSEKVKFRSGLIAVPPGY